MISKNTELLKKLTPKITKRNSLGKHRSILNTMHNGFRKDPGYTPISDAEIDLLFMKGLMKFIFLNSNKIEKQMNEIIFLAKDWRIPVKLLAAYCMTVNNTSESIPNLDIIRKSIIDKFGLDALSCLWALEEAGIIKSGKINNWNSISEKFELLTGELNVGPSSVYYGNIPLSTRIVEKILKNEWGKISTALGENNIPYKELGSRNTDPKRALVVYIGGSMYGEITALRKTTLGVAVDVITTEMLSTNKLLTTLANGICLL